MFDEEPYVILLYKIVDLSSEISDTAYYLVDKVKGDYRDKNKIFVPDSLEELNDILEFLMQEVE